MRVITILPNVVPYKPIEVLDDGRMWCFDCNQFFKPQLPPRRYTLDQLTELASTYINQLHSAESKIAVKMMMDAWWKWLGKREKE